MKIIKFVLTCLVLFVTVSFAVSNKQPVSLTLWPFPFEAVVPLGFAVLAFSLLFLYALKNDVSIESFEDGKISLTICEKTVPTRESSVIL